MQSVTPTHMVPQAGLPAWTDADASTTPAAHLDPGLEVQVLTRWGDWAYIRCSNNWSAWVDGRRLHPLTPAQAVNQSATATGATVGAGGASWPAQQPHQQYARPAAVASGGPHVTIAGREVPITAGLGGVLLVVVGAVLDWIKDGGNAFDLPIKFLFSLDAAADDTVLAVGWLLVVLAIAAAAGAVLKPEGSAIKAIGSTTFGICVLYTVQIQRLLSLNKAPGAPGLFSVLGVGLYVTAIGAVLMIVKIPLGGARR